MPHLTTSTKPVSEKAIQRSWHIFDAYHKVVGRLTTKIAVCLTGKSKVNYVPYLDMGDYVVVINARSVILTGFKEKSKVYARYSGYPGGLKKIPFLRMRSEDPKEIIRHAVAGMLPKNKLRKRRLTRLFVFKDEKHPYNDKFTPPQAGKN